MKMGKNAIVYFISELALKAIPFLMLPFVTSFLTNGEYGILNLLLSINEFIVILIAFSMPIYFKLKFQVFPRDRLLFQCISIMTMMFFLVFLVYTLIYFSRKIDGLLWYLPLFSFFQVLYLTVVAYYQSEEKFVKLVKVNVFVSLCSVCITVFILLNGGRVEGRLVGIFIPYIIAFIAFAYVEKIKFKRNYECIRKKELLKFGSSLLPSNLSWWFKGGYDKVFLAQALSFSEVGLYSLAFQITSIFPVLVNVVNQVLLQKFYKLYRDDRAKAKRLTVSCIVASTALALVLAILLPYCGYFFERSFSGSMALIPWFILAFWAHALVVYLSNWLIVTENNSFLSFSSLFSIVIYVALINILFPKLGILAPIVSSFVSNAILSFTIFLRVVRGKH